jgi:hypothetical protein
MIQVFFFVFFLLSLSSAEDTSTSKKSEQRINWVSSLSKWHPATDKLGSTMDTTGGLYQDSSLQVQFTITQKKTPLWPFVELIFESPYNLSGSQGIELEYKCDRDLVVKLFQEDFGPSPKGNDTYSLYQIKVPSSANWKTLRLNYSDFLFPTWVPEKSKGIAMNLEKTKKIYFTPAIDARIGGRSKIQVRALRFIKK